MKKMNSNTAGQVGESSGWRRDVGEGERRGEGALTKWGLGSHCKDSGFYSECNGGHGAPEPRRGVIRVCSEVGKLAAVTEKELEGQRMETGAREETAVQIQARDEAAWPRRRLWKEVVRSGWILGIFRKIKSTGFSHGLGVIG